MNHPSDYAYDLPSELIAKEALADRAASRLLVLHRAEDRFEDRMFRDFPSYLRPGDCLILNNTKVIPARLFGTRPGFSGKIEILLVRGCDGQLHEWEALVRPGRKLPAAAVVEISETLQAEIVEVLEGGLRRIRLIASPGCRVEEEVQRLGHVPLPPYLGRPDHEMDRARYQTVYAQHAGSSAAPTAGLHFTPEILEACEAAGARRTEVTLHVGLGTFQPLTEENLKTSTLHHEYFEVSSVAAENIQRAQRRVCVGTTSVRTIETAARNGLPLEAQRGDTQIFIRPGFDWKLTDALLTNFHLPESSLMMLVGSFAGYELTMRAYRHAVQERYRFFSYGDAMLIL